jgi:hypothetical protein
MIRVWKCDFCCHTEKSVEKMKTHEDLCSHNPKFKKCYSCENYYTYWENECCKKDLIVFEGQEDGNCEGWETDNIKLVRKLKLKQLKNEEILEST